MFHTLNGLGERIHLWQVGGETIALECRGVNIQVGADGLLGPNVVTVGLARILDQPRQPGIHQLAAADQQRLLGQP